ncbi:hypothetical protein, partial [uncultured Legionella sp.]|uniref:hypothetical protein n=1 Tax=uncultured Legionella sp. TaxID=210934 RepID=UPI002613AF6B
EGKAPRDYAKTEETKKIFLLIDEGYAALKARESVFSKTDNECSNDEKTLHERHWTVINKKIHQESEYEAAIKKIYKEEAGKKNLTVEEKAQFSLFQQKFSSSMLLLHHLVTKKIIFDVTTETGQKICSCGEAAASSFAWLAYFKKVDFPVEELNVTCKHDIRIAHAVLILNRDQNTLITDFNGWKESLIIDPYFNRIFFFNFVSQYAQDTCIKMVDKFNLIAGSSNILPPFPTEISLPATMSLYNKCVVELRESIWSKVKNNFLPLIDNTETDSRVELFSINTF